MSTWEIMLGFQALTALVSLGVVLRFMYSKEPLEATSDSLVVAPVMVAPVVLASDTEEVEAEPVVSL